MADLSQEQIAELQEKGSIEVSVENQALQVLSEDVEIISEDIKGWLVANEGNLTVALEVELTDALRKEGMARELINRIQNLRKDSGLEITDRIVVTISDVDVLRDAVSEYGDYVAQQVLAENIEFAANEGVEVDFDDFKANITIKKV